MLIEESSRTEEGPPCLKTGARGCTGGEEEEEEDENEEEVSWALLVPVPMGLLRRRCYAGSKPYPRAVAVINRHFASTTHTNTDISLDVVAGNFPVRRTPRRHAINTFLALKTKPGPRRCGHDSKAPLQV